MSVTGTIQPDITNMVVYRATAPNGKNYIGITSKGLEYRQSTHKRDALNNYTNSMFHKAIRKYGFDNIEWEILEKVEDKKTAQERERFYIQQFDTYNCGYNMTLGGEGLDGVVITEEAKRKMSVAKKGMKQHPNTRAALDRLFSIKHPRTGAKLSEESKSKISNATMGRPYPALAIERSKEKTQRAVSYYNKEGTLIKSFISATNAYSWLNKNKTGAIIGCCRGRKKTAYGYVWKYKEDSTCQ